MSRRGKMWSRALAIVFVLIVLLGLVVACNQAPVSPADPGSNLSSTVIDAFGANPNPSPANVGTQFSWTVFGRDLVCKLDVEGDGKIDYTVQSCTSQSRVIHTYGTQGSFDARLTLSGADGRTLQKTTPVSVSAPNTPPNIPSLTAGVSPSSADPLAVRFTWTVADFDADITRCRFDAESDGVWDFDNLCSGLPASSSVGRSSLTTFTYTHPYRKPGRYEATLEAADPFVSTRSAIKVRVPWNLAPEIETLKATAGSNFTARVGFTVSDPDDDPLNCTLSVQSIGTFRYSKCATLTRNFDFGKPGTYKVTLEVSDGQASSSKSVSLTLQNGPPPPPLLMTVSTGFSFNCSVRNDKNVYCWGSNGSNQLGNNSDTDSAVPVAVVTTGLSGTGWTTVSAVGNSACGLRSDGTAWCWGDNDFGSAGNDTTTDNKVPVAVTTTGVSGTTWTSLVAGEASTCGIRDDGTAWCWGFNDFFGMLGNGTFDNSSVPVAVTTTGLSGTGWKALTIGAASACGIRSDDTAWCWGYNHVGQLGTSNNTDSNVPVAVSTTGLSGTGWKALEASYDTTCGIRSDDTAWCWGTNTYGQLGNSSNTDSNVPVAVSTSGLSGTGWKALSGSSYHFCGIRSDDTAWCWGRNGNGRLGDRATTNSNVPVQVDTTGLSGTGWTMIGAGRYHSCGLRNDASVWCWGEGDSGQLGNDTYNDSLVPVKVVNP